MPKAVYMLDHGYPATSSLVPSALHECLNEVSEDYRGVEIIQLLHARKYDINKQIAPQWFTPLHISIRYVSYGHDMRIDCDIPIVDSSASVWSH